MRKALALLSVLFAMPALSATYVRAPSANTRNPTKMFLPHGEEPTHVFMTGTDGNVTAVPIKRIQHVLDFAQAQGFELDPNAKIDVGMSRLEPDKLLVNVISKANGGQYHLGIQLKESALAGTGLVARLNPKNWSPKAMKLGGGRFFPATYFGPLQHNVDLQREMQPAGTP